MASSDGNLGIPNVFGFGGRAFSTPSTPEPPIDTPSTPNMTSNNGNTLDTATVIELLNASGNKPKLQAPEKFDGAKRDTDGANNWLFKMERYLLLAQIDSKLKVIYAAQYLTDNAQFWYRTIAGNQFQSPSDNWIEFKETFKARFEDVNSDNKMLEQFFTITQAGTRSRSLREYIETFTRLWSVVHTNISEPVAVSRFVQGLQPRTRIDVQRAQPVTLSAAIQLADAAEGINVQTFQPRQANNRYQKQPRRSDSPGFGPPTPYYGPEPMDLSMMTGPVRPSMKTDQRQKGLCFMCNKPGHIARNCPTGRVGERTNSRPQGPKNYRT